MKPFLFLCFWVFLAISSFSQTDPLTQAQGARSQGLGNIKTNLPDAWTIFNSVGALDRIKSSQITSSFDSRFGLKELSTFGIAGAFQEGWGTFGFGISRFGGELFNQHLMGLGFSNTLGIVSLGAKIEWFQTQIEGFGTGNSFLFSFGGVAELGPKTFFGANFSNINRARFSKNRDQRIPTFIEMGVTYLPSKNISLYSEIEKEVDTKAIFKVGLEYKLKEWICLRTGISSTPNRLNFGFGIRRERFGFDYAFGQNSILGSSHHFSLGLFFSEK